MTPLARFERSLVIDQEKWRDGIGYDLDAIRDASDKEREAIESLVIQRSPRGWREIEALAVLDTPRARDVLRSATEDSDAEVRAAVAMHAGALIPDDVRTASLVRSLEEADFYGGLSQAIDEAAEFHPPAVVDALCRGLRARDGSVAVHFAALLDYIHGGSAEAFDMDQRPFYLRFQTDDPAERESAIEALRIKLGLSNPF
jgi:HEAT repeat protein